MSVLGKKDVLLVDDFGLWDGSGNPVTGVAESTLTIRLIDPTGTLVYERIAAVENVTTIPVTVVELGHGQYRASFTPNAVGDWQIIVTHPTYSPWGMPENYQVFLQLFDDISLQNLGPGNRIVTVTIQDDVSFNPVVDVMVQVMNTALTTMIAFRRTNASGQIVFALYDGDYKVILSKPSQYSFTVPEDLTVSGDTSITYFGSLFDPGSPPSSETCIVFGWEQDVQQLGLEIEIKAEIVGDDNFLTANPHIVGTEVIVTSDSNHANGAGYWSMALLRSGQFASADRTVLYQFTICDMVKTVEIPNVANVALADLIDP